MVFVLSLQRATSDGLHKLATISVLTFPRGLTILVILTDNAKNITDVGDVRGNTTDLYSNFFRKERLKNWHATIFSTAKH